MKPSRCADVRRHRTPHLYVLTRQGSDFKVAYIGAIDDNSEDAKQVKTKYVENAMTEIIAGKPATTSSTKPSAALSVEEA
jgi:hypothetical protein